MPVRISTGRVRMNRNVILCVLAWSPVVLLRHRHSSDFTAVADTMFQLQYLLACSRLLRCCHSGNVSPEVVSPFCSSTLPSSSTPTAASRSIWAGLWTLPMRLRPVATSRGVNLGGTGDTSPEFGVGGRQCIMSPQILTFSLYFPIFRASAVFLYSTCKTEIV